MGLYTLGFIICYWWEYADEKTRVNLLNKKLLLIPWGLKVPIWQINLCSRVFRLSEPPRCRKRTQTAICCFGRGRLKCLPTGLDTSLSFLSTS